MKNSFNKVNIFTLLLFLVNLSIILYLLILLYYNRLSQDDYGSLMLIREVGLWDYVKTVYLKTQGRFSTIFINGLLFKSILTFDCYKFIQPLIWISNVMILFWLLKKYIKDNSFLLFNFSSIVINIFILSNFEFSSYFWVSTSSSYCFTMIGLPVMLLLLITEKRNNIIMWILLTFVSLWIGGCAEAFTPLVILLIAIFFLYRLRANDYSLIKALRSTHTKRIIYATIIISFGLLIVLITPANQWRLSLYEQPTIPATLAITGKNLLIFAYLLLFKIPYLFFLGGISLLIGYQIKNFFKETLIRFNVKQFFISFLLLILVIWISTWPAAYAMSGFGFHRIYNPVIFWMILFICFWCFLLGIQLRFEIRKEHYKVAMIAMVSILTIQVSNIILDSPQAKKYADSDKDRLDYLIRLKNEGNREPIFLKPLYKPYTSNFKYFVLKRGFNKKDKQPLLFYLNEIDYEINEGTDVGFSNMVLMGYFELGFPIYLEKSK